MINQDKIAAYMECILYSASRPHISEVVTSSIDCDRLSKADPEAKLLTLGALLATGKYEEFVLLLQQLDFNDIPPDDKSFLAYCIFTDVLATSETSSSHADALLQLLIALSPEQILAHKLKREPFKQVALVELDYARKINASVSGNVFMREFQSGPGSRKNEFGHRIQSSLASQGWDVSLLPLQELLRYSSPYQKDFVLVDVIAFWKNPPIDHIRNALSHLKRYFRKIIIIELDPWTGLYDEMLRDVSDYVDYIWGFTSEWSLTQEPCYRGKSILFPNVGGFDHLAHSKQFDLDWNKCTYNFTGSVQGYNINRAYWILEVIRLNLPIEIIITLPGIDDGLDCESSLQLYAQKLAATHASLNLVTRKEGSRIFTGRAVEVISLNRLLIQENCPAFQHYYVEGEHFLEFAEIEGLSTIIEFLKSHPKVGQRICSQGHQFYLEKYSSRKLVEHIQTLL